jgi:hypothetical protein
MITFLPPPTPPTNVIKVPLNTQKTIYAFTSVRVMISVQIHSRKKLPLQNRGEQKDLREVSSSKIDWKWVFGGVGVEMH